MASKTSNAHVKITVDGQQAIAFYSQLQKRERELAASVKAGNKDAEKELKQVQGYLTDVKNEMQNVADVVKGKVFANLATLERMAKQVKMQMKYAENIQELRKLQTQYKVLTDRIREMTNQTQNSSHAFGRLFQRAAEYTSFYMILNRGRAVITNAIQGNLKLSDSISDIQKVSGLSEEAVKGLVSQIEKIDSRNAPEVLNNMAYAAGKLGIKGTENLLGFTRAADKLNVALKEYLGDGADGVVRLMKFANVMGTTDQYGVEQALLKTGSALNYMTQSTAAAADYMIDFAGRFGPIARQARMTSGDVIGLASALDALTVNNEEAATSLQKFVVKLLSAPTQVSKALGLNAQVSKEMVETGKSIELVEMALGKLGERAEKYGVSGIASVIGDIGSKGQAQRLIKTLATLSNNTEMVANYVTMANDAFEKGTSVIDEYNIKNQNAAAIMERAKNEWQKMLVNASEVGVIKDLAQSFYDLTKSLKEDTVWMGSMKVALEALVGLIQILIQALPSLIIYLSGIGLTKIVIGLRNATVAMYAFITSVKAGTVSWRTFSLAMKTNAIGLLISALPIAIDLFSRFNTKMDDAKKSVDRVSASLAEFHSELNKQKQQADELFARAKAAKEGTEQRKVLIAQINNTYKTYLSDQLQEAANNIAIAKAQEEVNKQLRQTIAYKLRNQTLESVDTQYMKGQHAGLQKFTQAAMAAGVPADDAYRAEARIVEMVNANKGKKGWTNSEEVAKKVIDELAKGDRRWSSVWSQRSRTTTDQWGWHHDKQGDELNFPNMYTGIHNYIASLFKGTNLRKQITKEFEPLVGDYTPPEVEPVRTQVFPEVDPNASDAEKKELEEAKQQVASVKSQLQAFYEWRASEIEKMRDKNEITEATKDMMIEANKAAHAMSEMKAWQYMLDKKGAKEAWDEQMQVMQGEILKANPQMQALWEYISQVNLRGLGSTLQRLGTQEVGGLEKTIAQDADIIEKHAAKMAQAIQKELEKYDYIATVRTKFVNGLTQLGLLKTKYDTGEAGAGMWEDNVQAANAAVDQIQSHYDELFDIDINTNEGVEKFRSLLFQCSALSVEMVEANDDAIRLLYEKALEMGEEYTMALKRQTDKQKRIIDERWKRDPVNLRMQNAMKGQEQENKVMGAISQKWGLNTTEYTQDAEIQLYAMRLQAATDYYNKLKAEKADQRLLDEQEIKIMEAQMALTEKLGAKMTEMQQWFVDAMNTLPDYGTALGEAFSKADPKERADAFKEANKEILKSLGEATKKMIIEWTKQRIQHAINQQLMAQDSKKAGQEQFDITTTAETAIANATAAIGQQTLQTEQAQNAQSTANEAGVVQDKVKLGIVGASAKTLEELGWWGVPLIAVITALLNGLLSWALGSLFKGKSSTADVSTKMKLVPGMLTYDEGNVGSVLPEVRGKRYEVRGNDGRTYSALPVPTPDGTALVNHPIATMIGGQPSLVGERGQELIIGRRTLRDMTQFRPDLLQQIAMFERRRFRTYDSGNVGEVLSGERLAVSGGQNAAMTETLQQMQAVLSALSQQLQQPIRATINKYGAGGLVEEVADGLYSTKRRGNNVNVKRLFG